MAVIRDVLFDVDLTLASNRLVFEWNIDKEHTKLRREDIAHVIKALLRFK